MSGDRLEELLVLLKQIRLTHPMIYTAADNPDANDDEDDGYKRGDIWVNTTDDGTFICRNPAAAAADWKEI